MWLTIRDENKDGFARFIATGVQITLCNRHGFFVICRSLLIVGFAPGKVCRGLGFQSRYLFTKLVQPYSVLLPISKQARLQFVDEVRLSRISCTIHGLARVDGNHDIDVGRTAYLGPRSVGERRTQRQPKGRGHQKCFHHSQRFFRPCASCFCENKSLVQ